MLDSINDHHFCENARTVLARSPNCFNDSIHPNLTDCDQTLFVYRLILFDCYITRIFFPAAAGLVVLGTVLNLFSLYCFLKMKKRNSQNVYLSVLSLSDTINLHLNFTIPLLRQFDSIDNFFNQWKFLCRVNGFFTEFFLIFPTWIVVLLTCERLICILWPLKCYSLYTHKRAKASIAVLAFVVVLLSLYRFKDLKGIDQVSVFNLAACGTEEGVNYDFIRNVNLIVWATLPECVTLIMSLIIIYNIKLVTRQFQPCRSKARETRYNQATKTVLLISILFLVFHTPTGIMITLHLVYANVRPPSFGLTVILVVRKITVILYEISLCCKFFIYNRTFRTFKSILHASLTRFTRHSNSAKLGRPVLDMNYAHHQHAKTFQFGPNKRQAKESDGLVRHQHKNSPKTSTSSPKGSREAQYYQQQQQQQQHMAVVMIKTNADMQVSIFDTPNLLRRFTTDTREAYNNRLLWRCKPQTTL